MQATIAEQNLQADKPRQTSRFGCRKLQPVARTRDPMNDLIRKNLKAFRLEADMSTDAAAQASGIPLDNLRRYETGGSGVPSDVLFKLAEIYGHDVADFAMEHPPKANLSGRPVFHLRTTPGVDVDEKEYRRLQDIIAKTNADIRSKRTRKGPSNSDK